MINPRKFLFPILCLFNVLFTCSINASPSYKISLKGKSLIVTAADGSYIVYQPDFIVLASDENPNKQLRKGNFAYKMDPGEDMGVNYKVPTWGKKDNFKKNANEHIEDGFNPEIDRSYGKDRTANYFLSAISYKVSASKVEKISANKIVWKFAPGDKFTLEATISLSDKSNQLPKIEFSFIPKMDGWYSVGYVGAPDYNIANCEEIWQAHLWQEKRFPNEAFLSESFRTSVPTTLLTYKGITNGIVADPKFIPFEPLPTSENSQFGVMIRNQVGNAQSILFAPVLGNKDSKMTADSKFNFTVYLFHQKSSILNSYEWLARNICEFKDYRSNSTCNLNTTIDNMTDYCTSSYAMFIDSLRGCNYSTDVPGAVKNISGLHPLEVSILTDNEKIFKRFARPMLEYGLSREKFLFSTNEKVNGQGTSSNLNGPGVPLSDLSTTYIYSKNRLDYFLKDAESLYKSKVVRRLNLDGASYEDRWQNSLFLYKATGERAYLDSAKKDCDLYLAERVNKKQTDFKDKLSLGMFFWTSYTNQWMELLEMYYTTGDQKYLDSAHEGARYFTQFCWVTPVIPSGKITVNKGGIVPLYRKTAYNSLALKLPECEIDAWKVSEIGLTPESSGTSAGGHRAIFMAHHAPFMLRIAALTGDKFLHDMARSAVVGRYESFPGYHINAGRTNAFERADFALHSQNVLNNHTSMHYNHPWSHLAMIFDYLVSDIYYASKQQIDFPTEYAEGYGYTRSFIYGAHTGKFYDEQGVNIYMPKGLVKLSNVQINYLAGYGNGNLYVALSNQSSKTEDFELSFDNKKAFIDPAKKYRVKLWKQNKEAGYTELVEGKLKLVVLPHGITAMAIEDVQVKPQFQTKLEDKLPTWSHNYTTVNFEKDRAVLFNFGGDLLSVYVWNEAKNSRFTKTKLHYAIDGVWKEITKTGYPYEYTIELPVNAQKFEYRFESTTPDDKTVLSEKGTLEKK